MLLNALQMGRAHPGARRIQYRRAVFGTGHEQVQQLLSHQRVQHLLALFQLAAHRVDIAGEQRADAAAAVEGQRAEALRIAQAVA